MARPISRSGTPRWRGLNTMMKGKMNDGDKSDAGDMGTEDPGAVDNRLSLDPSDERWSDALENWEDGEEYELTNVRIRQIGAGEFEIVSLEISESGEEPEDIEDQEPEQGIKAPKTAEAKKDKAVRGVTNPAVLGMLGKNR